MKFNTLLFILLVILLAACVPTTAPQDDPIMDDTNRLDGTSWELTGYGDPDSLTPPVPGSQITLTFDGENVGGSAGCNSYGGSYTLNGSQLTFGEMPMTQMACVDNAIMTQETDYMGLLWQTDAFTIRLSTEDGNDTLTLTSDAATLVYSELLPLALEDSEWQLSGIASGTDAIVSTWVDELITLTFADGNLSGNAGCNTLSASYEAADGTLTLGPIATTRMMCDEERNQREADLLAALAQVTGYTTDFSRLTLTDANGEMLLSFRPLPVLEPAELYGRVWQVVSLETPNGPLPIQGDTPITAQFLQGHIWGDSGCAVYAAPSHIVAANYLLLVSEIGKTAVPCDSAAAQIDNAYFDLLQNVNAFLLEEDALTFYTDNGSINLVPMTIEQMANSDTMPRFVSLPDGRRCDRLTPQDTVTVAGQPRSYVCQGSGNQFILGSLVPEGDGWRATLAELTESDTGYAVANSFEVVVGLPQR